MQFLSAVVALASFFVVTAVATPAAMAADVSLLSARAAAVAQTSCVCPCKILRDDGKVFSC
ncbi:hypothetical protein GALMADRAFT_259520 [Galerina marginata CBS 339.88]|uniref:Uncharacterized protein n=1 Tax=Galerina marginata (strain CBS 339.88) TaxID=685588 RepID=A0A067S6C0_GALM3|nr:hypothetical protein GALMADRAFT_259520 [Galerina marginata CBS 339.88]